MIPVIEKLGGRDEVFNMLQSAGFKIRTKDAVRMWQMRGKIAGGAIVPLMQISRKLGIVLSPEDFLPVSPQRKIKKAKANKK